MNCILLDSLNPYENQAAEEVLFSRRTEDLLLLWRNAPTVVCGKYQNIYAEVSVAAAQAMSIALIRRETGGGTVYHDEGNLNYAFLCKRTDQEGYTPFLQPMITLLRKLGVPAEAGRICDISVEGKKISGSAQKVTKDRIWHHGTLLFSADLHRLHSVANGARAHYVSKGVQSSPWPVTNLCDYLPAMDVLSFRDAIVNGLNALPTSLTAEEQAEATRLAEEKYHAWDWTFGKNPAFTLTRATPFGTLTLSAYHGVITDCILAPTVPPSWVRASAPSSEHSPSSVSEHSPSSVSEDSSALASLLVGQPLDPKNPILLSSPLVPYLF